MAFAHDIIIKPIITEESMAGAQQKKYTFKVASDATKPVIAKAAEEVFGVKVKKVNTVSMKGHFRRYGRFSGYKSDWKKAIITLTDDSKTIEFFDAMS
ncbi:MAG: 50S ribosomal protein L23 [Oscillospiraceae bacterium]|jgi:large subunit ribosomal protein L23|nr:50S ribosomal protein L23 [Oscillospiraceae bacterium]